MPISDDKKNLSAPPIDSSLLSNTIPDASSAHNVLRETFDPYGTTSHATPLKSSLPHFQKHEGFTVHQWAFSCFIFFCIGMAVSYFLTPKWMESKFDDKYQQGYSDGEQYGYDGGYSDGYDKGLRDGYDSGLFEGSSAFSVNSYDEGYNEGYGRGYEAGHESGYDAGYTAACENNYADTYMYTPPNIP